MSTSVAHTIATAGRHNAPESRAEANENAAAAATANIKMLSVVETPSQKLFAEGGWGGGAAAASGRASRSSRDGDGALLMAYTAAPRV